MALTLAKWMNLIIAVNIMFAPILAYVDSKHRAAVEVVLQEASKQASIEGRYSDALISDMKKQLVDNYNFDESKLNITATQTLTTRGNYISASIEAPRGIIFVFNIFNQGARTFEKDTRVMSEY
ncbi:hypothetical protein [Halobacillus litoralis]|uniref:Uncharacterized protein n=1 Tax=Halobacillus litoralis TaxID=45668 RepID=A0A410MJA6_9BACI|nr:hypothetical protein [Halobacillus litoralis]QAS54824.1 hypothetical protein HLI_21465 [Halobacillus litoralis]